MLRYLVDEQISPVVAQGVSMRRSVIRAVSVHRWRDGILTGAQDAVLLSAAAEEKLTLVTYDLSTIPGLLMEWAEAKIPHSGVIFVDELSIASNDYGGLIRGLIHFWKRTRRMDWTNRISYLHRS